ncbi:MAG: YCF48-related protein, partial [Candidatus Korobacteraceae bacterium]
KGTSAQTASSGISGVNGADALALKDAGKDSPAPSAAATTAGEGTQATANIAGAQVAAPAPAPHTASVGNQAEALHLRPSAALAKSMMSVTANAAPEQWRISDEGHLERRVTAGEWTRVLADQATTFGAVSVIGSEVWAGGSSGALFHSSDGGQHWSQVPLINSSGAETGAIVSIQFNDERQGTVVTNGGSRWTTSDGGVIWALR